MYLPKHFEETDRAVLHALIRSHPLSTWVTHSAAGLAVNHIPFMLDRDAGPHGKLVGHVARANPVWKTLSEPAVVVFQGPEAYISPSWYPSKQEHGKAVPTWNYAVVHAHGTPTAIEDVGWLRQFVTRFTQEHESRRDDPWQVSDAPTDYIEKMLGAIVGIEIPLTALTGKWKVSQNRPLADQEGMVSGLNTEGDARAREMALLVTQRMR